MRLLDWIVLVITLGGVVSYGLWRSRGRQNLDHYVLAERSMPWYAMALSIMATQASAITFISTPGQAYVDGMRFVQFYFGLPLAMVILASRPFRSSTARVSTRPTSTWNSAST